MQIDNDYFQVKYLSEKKAKALRQLGHHLSSSIDPDYEEFWSNSDGGQQFIVGWSGELCCDCGMRIKIVMDRCQEILAALHTLANAHYKKVTS